MLDLCAVYEQMMGKGGRKLPQKKKRKKKKKKRRKREEKNTSKRETQFLTAAKISEQQ